MRRCWVFHSRLVWGVLKMYLLRPLKRRPDVPIRCREDVPLRPHGNVLSRRRWVFHLRRTCDVSGTYRETLSRRRHDVLLLDEFLLANYWFWNILQKQPSRVVLRESCSKICNKFTGKHPWRSVISINVAKQLYWNHTLAWVFSCKFAAYFQNTFSQDRFWRAAPDS